MEDSTGLPPGEMVSLGLSPLFPRRLEERNILCPTEIQRRVIPRLLNGESFLFSSSTGTGKTFAYLLPLLERLLEGDLRGRPLMLVAAPTYELCSQIRTEADFLLKDTGLHTALLIGSAAITRQVDALKKDRPEVIVGNPGRILALARLGKLKLKNIRYLVLDEGDRLVQDELFEETAAMVSQLGAGGFQGTACSATLPPKSRERLLPILRIDVNPETSVVSVEEGHSEDVLREKVEHWAFFCEGRDKISLLRSLIIALEKEKGNKIPVKALIFTSRASQIQAICGRLIAANLPAGGLSGDMDKIRRKQFLDSFRSSDIRYLVSSDLAARGLDIPGITHVIAMDVIEDRNAYIHRAGRTARAGKGGIMVSIGTEGEMLRLKALEKSLRLVVYPKVLYGGKILAP